MKVKLTPAFISALAQKPRGKVLYFDESISGLILSQSAAGSLRFVHQFSEEGKQRRITFKDIQPTENPTQALAEARSRVLAHQAGTLTHEPAKGSTQVASKPAKPDTLGGCWARLSRSTDFLENSAAHQRKFTTRVETEILPLLGHDKPLAEVSQQDAQRLFDVMADPVAARSLTGRSGVCGGPYAARSVVGALRVLLAFGLPAGAPIVTSGVKLPRVRERDFLFTEAEFGRVMDYLQDQYRSGETYVMRNACGALLVMAMTGCRPSEVFGVTWGELDTRNGNCTIKLTEHKTARKTGRTRDIPLVGMARDIIEAQPRGTDSDLIFPGAKAGSKIAHQHVWARVVAACDLPEGACAYGLRHHFGTKLAEGGLPLLKIADAMGHSSVATTEKYMRRSESNRVEAAEAAARLFTPKPRSVA